MKQHLLAIVTLLLLGAITTLSVAWISTLGLCPRATTIRTAVEWQSPQGAEIVTAELTRSDLRHPSWMGLLQPSVDLGPGAQQRRALRAYGWPLPSMLCGHAQGGDEGNGEQWSRSINALPIHGKELPLKPTWSGFALDTVFFAVAWTAVMSLLTLACRLWKSTSMRRSQKCRQ